MMDGVDEVDRSEANENVWENGDRGMLLPSQLLGTTRSGEAFREPPDTSSEESGSEDENNSGRIISLMGRHNSSGSEDDSSKDESSSSGHSTQE